MNPAVRLGLHYILSGLALPLGVGLRYGAAAGVITLGVVATGHFLLDTYLLHRSPGAPRE